jgi:hypothetical protein
MRSFRRDAIELHFGVVRSDAGNAASQLAGAAAFAGSFAIAKPQPLERHR